MEEALQSMDWEYLFKLLELVLTVAAFTTMLGLFKICHWLIRSEEPPGAKGFWKPKAEDPEEGIEDPVHGPNSQRCK